MTPIPIPLEPFLMREVFQIFRHDSGEVEVHVGTQSTAAARRLLIDAAHTVNALDDIDSYDAPAGATAETAAETRSSPRPSPAIPPRRTS